MTSRSLSRKTRSTSSNNHHDLEKKMGKKKGNVERKMVKREIKTERGDPERESLSRQEERKGGDTLPS